MASFNNFLRVGKAIRSSLVDRRREAAADLAADWRSRVHVITGAYRDSIHVASQGDNTDLVAADAPYAQWEEWGTRYRPGHPAFTPAVEEARAKYGARFKGLI